MKRIILSIIIACLSLCIFFDAHAQVVTDQGVQLTADQSNQVASIATSAVQALPAKEQNAVDTFLRYTVTILIALRGLKGFIQGGFSGSILAVLFGHHTFTNDAPESKPGASNRPAVGLFLCLGLAGLMFLGTGCAHTEAINNNVIHGFNAEAEVPIPFSGGVSLLGVKLQGGVIQNNQIIQPVQTNGLTTTRIAIYQTSHSTAGVNASAVSSNSVAGINDQQADKNVILTDAGTVDSTNHAEHVEIP